MVSFIYPLLVILFGCASHVYSQLIPLSPVALPLSEDQVGAVLQDPNGVFAYLLSSTSLKRYRLDDWTLDSSIDLPYFISRSENNAVIDTKGLNIYIVFYSSLASDVIGQFDISGSQIVLGKEYNVNLNVWSITVGFYLGNEVLYLIEATRAGTQNLTLLSIPTLDQHSILLANWTLNDIYYNIYDGNLYFSTDDTTLYILSGPNNVSSVLEAPEPFIFTLSWNSLLFLSDLNFISCYMVDLEQKTSIKANFSCESRYNAVVTPTGPFFSNTQQNPQLFWPNEDYTGWDYYNTTTTFSSPVLILRSSTATSVSLNTVPYVPKTRSSFGVSQIELSRFPSNEFFVTNTSDVFEFQRGFDVRVAIVITLDQKNLIAVSFTSTIAKFDITDPNNVPLLSESPLLGPPVSLGVNNNVVAVVVANQVYDDPVSLNSNFSIQIFSLDTLSVVQTIPLPTQFVPSSLSIVNQTLVVVGLGEQVPSFLYYNIETNKVSSLYFTSFSSNVTTVILDQSGEYAFVAVSQTNGTLLKVRLSDMLLLFSYTTIYPITQLILRGDGEAVFVATGRQLLSLSTSSFDVIASVQITFFAFSIRNYMAYDKDLDYLFLTLSDPPNSIPLLYGSTLERIETYGFDSDFYYTGSAAATNTLFFSSDGDELFPYHYSINDLTSSTSSSSSTTSSSSSTTATTTSNATSSSSTTTSHSNILVPSLCIVLVLLSVLLLIA